MDRQSSSARYESKALGAPFSDNKTITKTARSSPFLPVLIGDGHAFVREGLVSILNREPGFQVVAEATTWPEAIEKMGRYLPKLAILDIHMKGMEALIAISAVRECSPATQIVLLSECDGGDDAFQAIRAGAKGYLPRESGTEALRECVHAVQAGKTWIHPIAASALAWQVQASGITSSEMKILRFVAAGKSNKEIGALLGVTSGTVKVHVSNVFAKLGVKGRVAATLIALRHGIVHLRMAR